MLTAQVRRGQPAAAEGARGALTPADLAELIASFNEVTSRLQRTHEDLRGEVSRLEGELREAHGQLRRARQLAALGEMAAGIAHEIRNPLGSIRLYASMLTQDLADRPSERSVAAKIGSAVGRLNGIVGDVLAFARELVVHPEEAPAGDLARGAVEACADLWVLHGVQVETPSASAGRIRLRCDAGLVHQALVNVLRNAAEAMGEDSSGAERRVRIGVERRRTLSADGERQGMVAIVVRDTGPGVPAEAVDRLFNPFFTTRHTGTGLGLAIVHRIIDAHGGRVTIRNNPGGRGASVEILLPGESADRAEEEVAS